MIKIGSTVYKILSEDLEVTEMVGDNIFPLIADTDTTFPFIVFKKDSYKPQYSKDGITNKRAVVEIIIASEDYEESVELAEKVFKAIAAKSRYFKLEDNTEDYLNDTFLQSLTYKIEK